MKKEISKAELFKTIKNLEDSIIKCVGEKYFDEWLEKLPLDISDLDYAIGLTFIRDSILRNGKSDLPFMIVLANFIQ